MAALGLLVGGYLALFPADAYTTTVPIPFLKTWLPNLGLLYIPFAMVVIVGCSNAVNLTDGLDGLAAGSATLVSAAYIFISFWQYRHACGLPNVEACYPLGVNASLDTAIAIRVEGGEVLHQLDAALLEELFQHPLRPAHTDELKCAEL